MVPISKKPWSDIDIRRIFIENDANEIKVLQSNASEFKNHYPNHTRWLDKSIKEIIDGKKVCFGVYRATFDSNFNPSVELIGTVILKKELYTDVVELKNLFIKTSFRNHGYGTELCNVAEKYCSKRGYSIIKTEVPADEFRTIKFLLSRGYRMLTTKESGYKKGDYLYDMVKTIVPLYGGDYFDLYELSSWLLRYVYGFSNIKCNMNNNTIIFDLDLKVQLNITNKNIISKGIVIVFDKDKIIGIEVINKISEEKARYNLVFVFGRNFDADARIECVKRGILLFDETLIYESFSDLFAYKPAQFSKEEIAGMIVLINPEYFKRIGTQSKFTYFKGDSIGKYLKINDKVLFFSEPSPKYPKGGVRGYGKVVDVYWGKPEDVWNKYEDENPLFTDGEYKIYSETEGIILGILVDDFKEIAPINYDDLEEIIGKDVDIEDIGHYYISTGMLNRFYDAKRENKENYIDSSPDAPRVFISSTFKDLQDERIALKSAITNDLKYYVYAFESGGSGTPARDTILKELKKSEVYICLIGERYGEEILVDGKRVSATEDEYNNAIKWKIPILVYVKKVSIREEKANEFLNKIGDYLKGSKWQGFVTTEELIEYVKRDIAKLWGKRK
jgi:ribosomal protein S18 acetylase RimI-like enzyme